MRIVIFGLTISSSWGNGHATLWRGLCAGLERQGHSVIFFEKDVPYYAGHRDLKAGQPYKVVLYQSWKDERDLIQKALSDCDAAVVTSYCPDAIAACNAIFDAPISLRVFYDLDSPVTLERQQRGERVEYLPANGLGDFDLVLSYAGGSILDELQSRLGAKRVAPLYGSVDPQVHHPADTRPRYQSDLSYLGTYSANRQSVLEQLFIEPARRSPNKRFLIGGALYPHDFPWGENIYFVRHVPPSEHPAFYSSSRLTLNVTRGPMSQSGYCPSGRLFEAAACGTAVVSDTWEGIEHFFIPGKEILLANTPAEIEEILKRENAELRNIGRAARERVMADHTAERRSQQFAELLEAAA